MNIDNFKLVLKGEPKFRFKQVWQAIFIDLISDWNENTTLPIVMREKLNEEFSLKIDAELASSKQSESQKALIKLDDGLNIETVLYNAKNSLPSNLKSQNSVAVTDPPYTPEGVSLFVSRCLEAIGRRNGVVYLSYGYSPRAAERALPIQAALTQMGLVLEEVRHDFSRYYAAQSIGSSSSLYVCRMTPRAKPLVNGDFVGDIYTRTRHKR